MSIFSNEDKKADKNLLDPEHVLQYDQDPQGRFDAEALINWKTDGEKAWFSHKLAWGRSPEWHIMHFYVPEIRAGEIFFVIGRDCNIDSPPKDFYQHTCLSSFSAHNTTPHQLAKTALVARIITDGGYRYLPRECPCPNLSIIRDRKFSGSKEIYNAFVAFDGTISKTFWYDCKLGNWDDFPPEKQEELLWMLLEVRKYAQRYW